MAGSDAVPDIGLEHGVIAHALDPDAVIGQHMGVVLQVVAQFWVLGILEQRFQRREHPGTRQLRRRAGVVMGQWHIGRDTRFDTERHADDLGDHVVEARGLRVECEQGRGAQPRQPGFKVIPAQHCFVAALGRSGQRPGFGRQWRRRDGADGWRFKGTRCRTCAALSWATCELAQQRTQFIARVQLLQLRGIDRLRGEIVQAQRQIDVRVQCRELPRQGERLKTAAQVLAHLALDLLGMLDNAVRGLVLGKPFGRGLRSHLGHPGNVVGRVAHQRQVIDDLFRPDIKLGLHAGAIQARTRHGIDDRDGVIHQLRHVLVTG